MRIDIGDRSVFSKVFNQLIKYKINSNFLNGVSIDSRKIQKGDIFIALKGGQYDGHNFIDDCISKGASFVINEECEGDNIIKVKSSKAIIRNMAILYRESMKCKVIGITGSNGKTTTKEMLFHILSPEYNISYTKGNFNSTIGMPISIFSISSSDEIFLAEMGTNQKGEIQYLCEIAQPDFGIITNIAEAHIENFDSLDEIYKEKSNLFKSVSKEGLIFVNMDDIFLSSSISSFNSKKIKYGFSGNYHYSAKVDKDKNNNLIINNTSINMPYLNNNIAKNILCSFTVASELGVKPHVFQKKINSFHTPNGRGNIIYKDDYTIINDTYNSNYSSTVAGIESLESLSNPKNRKIVILGDMLELGDDSKIFHISILDHLIKNNIKDVFLYGELMNHLYESSKNQNSDINIFYFENQDELIKSVNTYILKNDIIYIKGSRGMKMENIIKGIK